MSEKTDYRGARHVCPAARTLLDIGSQDTKVVSLDALGVALSVNSKQNSSSDKEAGYD